jgi:hypothetical protein
MPELPCTARRDASSSSRVGACAAAKEMGMGRFILPSVVLAVLTGIAIAGDVKSGLDPGKTVAAFTVSDVTGPNKGKSLCYRCAYEDCPVACVFTREITNEVATLVQRIDAAVGDNQAKDMKAFVVLLTEDAEGGAKQLANLAEAKGIKHVPLTIFNDPSGPRSYRISTDAAVTVLMWKKATVVVNHAFDTGKLTEEQVRSVAGDTGKILN